MMLFSFAALAAPSDLTSPVHIESGSASGICVSMFPSRPLRKKDEPVWEQVRTHVVAGEMREAVKLSKTAKTHPAQRTVAAAAYVAEQGLAIDIEPTVARYPNDPCLRQLAANVALRADDKAGARRHLDAAIRSAPDDPQLARLRALLAEDPAERLAGITVAADMHPTDVSLQRLATSVARENGQLGIALDYAMRAKKLGDEDGNLVALARETGNLDAYLRLLVDEGLQVVGPGLQEPGDLEARLLEWLELDELEDTLTAVFHTSMGDLRCDLLVAHAPVTVMNFVGLARGEQPWTTPDGKVVQRPIYNDTIFHRVIPEFMVQGGDPEGTGSGGPGYRFLDETDGPYAFDKPGVLAMANSGPATNGSQFFVTERPTAHLSGKHTIFGQCDEDSVRLVKAMARVPAQGTTPVDDIILESITFEKIGDEHALSPHDVPSP